MEYKFKKLETKQEGNWLKRLLQSPHIKRSIIFSIIGAIGSFLYFYFSEGQHMEVLTRGDIIKSLLIGGFFGFFITNSPCARGRC